MEHRFSYPTVREIVTARQAAAAAPSFPRSQRWLVEESLLRLGPKRKTSK
jgi:hypothetical protein